ncbi:uncharacterized protein UBRO_20562 [Ustilago bromivora]|uniref:Uncharacterized protein n=1 Tax=Ustilago bromivora TaxID=307758 RepID=A0A1K0G0D9_9BASI|nr:uncharacterized protein UBRO_20562 [Ustilago bromivora]
MQAGARGAINDFAMYATRSGCPRRIECGRLIRHRSLHSTTTEEWGCDWELSRVEVAVCQGEEVCILGWSSCEIQATGLNAVQCVYRVRLRCCCCCCCWLLYYAMMIMVVVVVVVFERASH